MSAGARVRRAPAIEVRPAQAADRDRIASLLDRMFAPVPRAVREQLWAWRRELAPLAPHMPPYLVAERDGEVVGAQGLVPTRLQVGDRTLVAAVSGDLAVSPAGRGCGLKLRLRTLAPEIAPVTFSTSTNEVGHRLMKALGGGSVDGVRKHILPLTTAPFLEPRLARWLGPGPGSALTRAVAPAADRMLTLRRVLVSPRLPRGSRLEPVPLTDARLDALWERASRRARVQVVRDVAYLAWRYARCPLGGAHAVALERDGVLLGLLVTVSAVVGGWRSLAIAELFDDGREPATRALLVAAAIRRAARERSATVVARTRDPDLSRMLEGYGFRTRTSAPSPVIHHAADPALAPLLATDEAWHLSLGDGDAWLLPDTGSAPALGGA